MGSAMLALGVAHRSGHLRNVSRGGPFYGIAAGFASTVANAAAPIMNMYLLSQGLSKEQFVATGAWFFFAVVLDELNPGPDLSHVHRMIVPSRSHPYESDHYRKPHRQLRVRRTGPSFPVHGGRHHG
jgi:hypothetical protein